MTPEIDYVSGNLHAMGDLKRDIHVHVRLSDADRTLEWRTVRAADLSAGIKVAEAMPDVEVVLEASFVPGGVVT